MQRMANKFNSLANRRIVPLLLLAFIILLATGLRFYKLGEWSFWYDEMYTLRSIEQAANEGILDLSLSNALISVALDNFGISEFSARLVPALFGIISVLVIYFPVRMMFNTTVALLSSLLLAISPWHLYWSQNARFYPSLLLFFTLALFAFYFALEKDRPLYLLLFLVFVGLAVKERLFAVFIVPIVGLYILGVKFLPFGDTRGLRWRNLLILIVPSFIIGLTFGWEYIVDPSRYLSGFGEVNNNPLWILAGVVYYISIPVMLLGAGGAVYLLYTKRDRAVLLLSIAALFPLFAVLGLAFVQYSANRYVFVSLTSWIILASLALEQLFLNTNGFAKLIVFAVGLLVILQPLADDYLYYRFQNGNRDDWKAAFAYIDRHRQPGDVVAATNPLLGEYYLDSKTVIMRGMNFDTLASKGNRVWFVEDINVAGDIPEKLNWIQQNATLKAVYDVSVSARTYIMRVYLYTPQGVQ